MSRHRTEAALAFFDCGGTRLMLEDRSILEVAAMLAIMSQVLPLV